MAFNLISFNNQLIDLLLQLCTGWKVAELQPKHRHAELFKMQGPHLKNSTDQNSKLWGPSSALKVVTQLLNPRQCFILNPICRRTGEPKTTKIKCHRLKTAPQFLKQTSMPQCWHDFSRFSGTQMFLFFSLLSLQTSMGQGLSPFYKKKKCWMWALNISEHAGTGKPPASCHLKWL